MEVKIYTDNDSIMFGNMLDSEKVMYTKEVTVDDIKRTVIIFRCVGDIKYLVEKLRRESECARLYYFSIVYLDEEGYSIETDRFTAQVMDTCSRDENREIAEEMVDAYCEDQLIHYDGADDWETKLIDCG